jgi:large subunit ribosomal protein L24
MAIHFHVKRGDTVQVITGNNKGATGKVLQVRAGKQQVIIEGVRMIKKHTKRSQDAPQGVIAEREGPIHISNVKLAEAGEKKTGGKAKAKAEKPAKAPKAEKAPKAGKAHKTEKAAKPAKSKKKAE